jgi:chromosome segregation ATPase
MEFKSATVTEFNRILDNRIKCLTEKCDAINRDHDELLKAIDKVDADNLTLRNELQAAHEQAADREAGLGADLVETKRLLAASESAKIVLEVDIVKARIELTDRRSEIMDMTARLAKTEAENDALIDGRKEILDNLNRADKAREEADKAAALAKQAVAHGQEMIDQLRRQNAALEEDVTAWKFRAIEFEKQRDEGRDKLLQAANARLENMKQTTTEIGTDKKKGHRPQKRQRITKPSSTPLKP